MYVLFLPLDDPASFSPASLKIVDESQRFVLSYYFVLSY